MPAIRFLGRSAAALAMLVCGLSAISGAQTYTPVTIVVTDPSGAVIPGAELRVTPGSPSGDRFVTDEQGRARIGMAPGDYELHAAAQGFTAIDQKVVVAGQPQTLTLQLRVETFSGPVMVNPGAPMQPGAVPLDAQIDSGEQNAMSAREKMASDQNGAAPATGRLLVITAGPGERGVFTPSTLKDNPHQTVTIFDHHTKKNETYSGVPLIDLLAHLGVPHGKDLMGKATSKYVVATGSDGYKTVLALAEIDPEFHPGIVLIADSMDGKPLAGKLGPFRLIISEDKRPARSVWGLVSMDVRSVE